MRILLDATAARFGGTAYTVMQTARVLARREDVESVMVLAERGSMVARGLGAGSVALHEIPASGVAGRTLWAAARLPSLGERFGAEVLVSMSGILPRRPGCRVVAELSNPVAFESSSPANRLRRAAIVRTSAYAERIVVPSKRMAELVGGLVAAPIVVAPHGVDLDLFGPPAEPGEDLLVVSDFYRHKRHELLIDTWLGLREPRPRLRMIGDPSIDPRNHSEVVAAARRAAPGGEIAVEGRVPLEELVAAYRGARLLLMPSRHESFSMPVAEALACGVPAVVPAGSAQAETAGAAGISPAGDGPAAWARAIQEVLDDPAEHARLRSAAIERSHGFSWPAFAEALVPPAGAPSVRRDAR